MEALPLHPVLVHLPIALAILMPLLAGGLLLAWWRGWVRKRVWALAVAGQALLFGGAIAATQTGEADEDRVERVVPEAAIEAHEEAAETFLWAGGAVLLLMLLPLAIRQRGGAGAAGLVATAGTLVVFGLGYRVGEAGGELVYRHGAASAFAAENQGGGSGGGPAPAAVVRRRVHDDDDQDER